MLLGKYNAPHYPPTWLLFLELLDPEDEDTITHRHIRKNSPSNITPHPENLNLQQHCCMPISYMFTAL
jgi:hypothetical protein